jgi:secretion system chaperone SscA
MLGESSYFEDTMVNLMNEGSSELNFAELLNPVKVKELYATAYRLYRDKHYSDAICFFRLLLVANPRDSKYWKGLGASLQMKGEYQEAINCYICTQTLMNGQPDPHLYIHAADCYFATGQVETGLKTLDAALLSAQEKMDNQAIHHVLLMKQMWSKAT